MSMVIEQSAGQRPDSVLQALCWYLGGALLFLSFGYTEMAGSDLWWHLAGGREILEQGTLWLRDTWSYTAAGERWRNHEWLSELIFYGWQQAFGLQALVYWKWLVLLGSYLGLQALLYRLSGSRPASLLLAALALAVAAPFIDIRPHLYSLAGFVTLLHLGLRRAPFWQFALLFLVWVNLHGGFIFGLMVLPLLLFPWSDFSWARVRRAALFTLGCTAVCTINPDGLKVVLMPLTYALQADSPFRQIAEWLPPWRPGGIRSPLFFWCLPLVPLTLLAYVLLAARGRLAFPWWPLLLCLLTLAMALTSRRFTPLFGIALAVFLAPLLGHWLGHLRQRAWQAAVWVLVVALALLRLAPYPLSAAPAFHYLTAAYSYPHDVVDVMLANELGGPVFAYYNWGGYLHWRSDGRLAVFIDGRANTLYGDATYLDYTRVLRSGPGWQAIIEDSGARYVLWPADRADGIGKARALLQSGRWQLLYRSGDALLLGRSGTAVPAKLAPGPESPQRWLSEAQYLYASGQFEAAAARATEVLAQVPYERDACVLRIAALRSLQRPDEAQAAWRACRAQFPSVYLR